MNLVDRFVDLATRPVPLRSLLFRRVLQRFPIGSWKRRLHSNAVIRPNYAWCLYHAALQARDLGYQAFTVVELGVAGGNGLLCLCDHAAHIQKELGIEVVVVGFDAGGGLPATHDLRDLHYVWPAGSFEMDHAALEKRLAGRARIILGDVADTIPAWEPRPEAPLGAVMFDLDMYTSTRNALQLLTMSNILPRVWCYFDDILGYPDMALTDFIGEDAAVRDFNEDPARSVMRDNIAPANVFKGMPPEPWHQQIYIYHRLHHPQYDICLSRSKPQLPLTAA